MGRVSCPRRRSDTRKAETADPGRSAQYLSTRGDGAAGFHLRQRGAGDAQAGLKAGRARPSEATPTSWPRQEKWQAAHRPRCKAKTDKARLAATPWATASDGTVE